MMTSMSERYKNQHGQDTVSSGIPARGPDYLSTSVPTNVFQTSGPSPKVTKNEGPSSRA